jgi:hypothetical protein
MKRKRKPGGGRKPLGPLKGSRAKLTMRLPVQMRKELEARAKARAKERNRKPSLSQEVQFHLQQSFSRFYHPRPDIIVLAEMIERVIQDVERTTEAKWTENAYTTVAIRAAIDSLVRHWGARGEAKVPLAIKELARRLPDNYAKKFQEAAEVGSWVAGRLTAEIEARGLVEGEGPHKLPDDLRLDEIPGWWEPPEWQHHRTIHRHLGSGRKRG